MPPWLSIWFTRFALGERWQKATSTDYRIAFGHFFFVPVFMILGSTLGRSFFDGAGIVSIWILLTVVGAIYFFGLILWWRKFIPAPVSAVLGVFAWAAFAFMSWHHM